MRANKFWLGPLLFVVAAGCGGEASSSHHVDVSTTAEAGHAHTETFEAPADTPAPAIELVVNADAKSGFNLQLNTVNFRFAPEDVGAGWPLARVTSALRRFGRKLPRKFAPVRCAWQRGRSPFPVEFFSTLLGVRAVTLSSQRRKDANDDITQRLVHRVCGPA